MSEIINVYCDESCHLEHDQSNFMVLGAIWCLYSIFLQDFVNPPPPSFRNLPIRYDNRKLNGSSYEEGFWHMVTRTDQATGERLPDFRRAERLRWCLPLIQNYTAPEVTAWKYSHAG